jgi:flagellar hook-associated protein 3 FlgL
MRISTGYQFESYSLQIALSESRMFQAEQQVLTGKRINVASDDPVGTGVVLNYRGLQTAAKQYHENLKMAKGFLGFTEEGLGETSTVVRRAYELAVRGANSATDQIGREGMAAEVTEMQKRLVEIANSRGPGGQYIFAGQAIDQKPYNIVAGALTYLGDANPINVEVGPADTLQINTIASPMYLTIYQQLEDLKTNLQGGNIGALTGISIGDLKKSVETVNLSRGTVGSKLQSVASMTDNYSRRIDEFAKVISDTEEVDMTEAIMKYQQAQTTYQAALQVASQGFGLSLMDFIRG